jgi:hypothetical protein
MLKLLYQLHPLEAARAQRHRDAISVGLSRCFHYFASSFLPAPRLSKFRIVLNTMK